MKFVVMKNILLFSFAFLYFTGLFAQLVDPKESVQNGVNNRANNRIEGGVEKGLDKVESGIGGLFKKKRKKTDSTAADADKIISIQPAGQTLQDFYLSLEVESHWLAGHHVNWETGEPDMPESEHGNKTHCSAFAASACKKKGIYLLSPPEHGQVLLANAQYDWLATSAGVKAGWKPVTGDDRYKQVQTLANEGKIVVAICKNADASLPGHAALVMPKERSLRLISDEGPEIIMAGTHNHNFISLKNGFHSHLPDWPEQEIRFYVYEH